MAYPLKIPNCCGTNHNCLPNSASGLCSVNFGPITIPGVIEVWPPSKENKSRISDGKKISV